jgi:hypothetical protein
MRLSMTLKIEDCDIHPYYSAPTPLIAIAIVNADCSIAFRTVGNWTTLC